MAESNDSTVLSEINYEDLKSQVGRIVTALTAITSNIQALTTATENTTTKLARIAELIEAQNASVSPSIPEDTPEETSTIDTVAAAEAKMNMESKAAEILQNFVYLEYGVTKQDRISFLSAATFALYKEGQSFDFTRKFVTDYGTITNTSVTEYALLVSDSSITTSMESGSTSIERIHSWKEEKIIQTVVILKNLVDETARLYFPTQKDHTSLIRTGYATEKKAMDAAVALYQSILEDSHASISIIPVSSITQGILQSDYFEKAKLITPSCEYN